MIECDVLEHAHPQSFNRVQVRAVGWQLDRSYAAVGSFEEFASVWAFMVSDIIPDDIDDARVRIARFDLGKKLRCADPVHGGRLDERRIKGL